MQTIGICTIACRVTSSAVINHPAWGRSTIVTTLSTSDRERDANIAAIDADGNVRWHHRAGDWYELTLADPPVDKSGNVLITYNPGRDPGVIILRATPKGFDSFGTLPEPGDYNARFYHATLTDTDRDGTNEVLVTTNDCTPTCANAQLTSTTYRWNGTGYTP